MNDGVREVIWARANRGSRGPRPAHGRDEIAEVAVRIADAEGIDAVSIRKVAAAIRATPNALYRYLDRKEELFELMIDAVAGELTPPAMSGDWRADLATLANHHRAIALRHPWLPLLGAGRTVLGPNTLRWMEHGLAVFDGHQLAADELLGHLETLTAFVAGHVLGELAEAEVNRANNTSREEWFAAQGAYGDALATGTEYPRLARVMREASGPHAADRLERSFQRGVAHILNGIAASLAQPRP